MNKKKYFFSIGKRKKAITLLYLKIEKNKFLINNKSINKYFNFNIYYINKIYLPLILTNNIKNNFFINIKVKGGGFNGQIESIILALAKVLCKINIENKKILKKNKLLTRDSRQVERKKFGRKKSRKKFQFSKR